jgi:hypothetical protein
VTYKDDGREYRRSYQERGPAACAAVGCEQALPVQRPADMRYCSKVCAERQRRRNRDRRERYAGYGADLSDYDRLFIEQGGRCAICGSESPGRKGVTRFAFDHDHETGRPRGLLCLPCNVGIGALQDDPELLRAAIAYLETHRQVGLRAVTPARPSEQSGSNAPLQDNS